MLRGQGIMLGGLCQIQRGQKLYLTYFSNFLFININSSINLGASRNAPRNLALKPEPCV